MKCKPTIEALESFLRAVDLSFPVPLSQKQELGFYARKLREKATLCVIAEGDRILSMAAGYTKNVVDDIGYISVVATLEEACGKGYASRVVAEFLDEAEKCELKAVHLYTAPSNTGALRMYKKLGFTIWHQQNEARPDDVHLIYWGSKEKKEENV